MEQDAPSNPLGALSTTPRRVFGEVLILWVVAIAGIGLFKLLAFVPFIRDNLWGIAGIIFLFLPLEYLRYKRADPEAFGLTWARFWSGLLWAFLFMAITFPPYVFAYRWWFGRVDFHFALPDTFWKEIVGNVLLVALPEEAFYRGYMQTRLDGVLRGRVKLFGAEVGFAWPIATGLFALGHLIDPRPDKLATFLPGLAFGWMRSRTGSIVAGVAFHAACNLWAQILRYGYFGIPPVAS